MLLSLIDSIKQYESMILSNNIIKEIIDTILPNSNSDYISDLENTTSIVNRSVSNIDTGVSAKHFDIMATNSELGFNPSGKFNDLSPASYDPEKSSSNKLSHDNYINITYAGGSSFNCKLPVYPDEISDTVSASWSEQQIIGRSSPIAAYIGASFREISFSILLHREISGVDDILKNCRRAVYPKYLNPGYIPAILNIKLGGLKLRGILKNISYTWQKPIINDEYMVCNLSMTIDEIMPSGYGKAGGGGDSSAYFKSPMRPFS